MTISTPLHKAPTLPSVRKAHLHAVRVAQFSRIASAHLTAHGHVSLGLLLMALRRPAKNESLLGCSTADFLGASRQQLAALYEPALNLLDREHGPLTCTDEHGKTWGYVGTAPSTPFMRRATPIVCRMMWCRRSETLASGHPDQRFWEEGHVPPTFWRR